MAIEKLRAVPRRVDARNVVDVIAVLLEPANGRVLDGIRIEDSGLKEGLNGVDNGRIWFDAVRVPRESLLNRFADVSADGTYSSAITNPTKRFFTTIGTLVAGRVSIASASVNASKSASRLRKAGRPRFFPSLRDGSTACCHPGRPR